MVTLRADGTDFKLKTPAGGAIRPGGRAQVRFDPARLHLFDPATGQSLRQTVPARAEAEAPDDLKLSRQHLPGPCIERAPAAP